MTGPGLLSLTGLAYCRQYSASGGAGIDELFCFAAAGYFANSRLLTLATWERRSFAAKVAQNLTRLLSPLL